MLKVSVFNDHPRYRVRKKPIIGYVLRVLKQEGRKKADVSVVFVNSRKARAMNRRYLTHDYVTDVISFCLEDGENLEGEIYVNVDRARQQAREYRVTITNEIARLAIHGALHLVGYDDASARAAKRMRSEEDAHVKYWFSQRRDL